MKKIITLFIFAILILLNSFSFGQTLDAKLYEQLKREYTEKYNDYIQFPVGKLTPVDPGLNLIQDASGNLVPSYNNTENSTFIVRNSPFTSGNFGWEQDLVNVYIFSSYAGTYTAITGGTVVASGAGFDDNTFPSLPIGFTFNYNNIAYTTFGIDANGYIWFGAVTPLSTDRTTVLASTTASDGFVVAMGYDLLSYAPSELRYQTQGVAPNRTLTVQYSKWGTFSAALDTMDFQIILCEGDSINFKYGTIKKDATTRAPQVGLRGATNTDWTDRINTTDWITTSPGTLNTSVMTLSTTNFPASGQTYSYKPPPPTPMVYTSSTTTQVQNGANVLQGSTNNTIIQVQVVMTGTLTPIDMTSMAFNTTGTTNPVADLTNAKVFYTGTTNVFNTTTQFGTTTVGPNGSFSVNGTQTLVQGTNYFWLTYDVPVGGPIGDLIDAQCTGITGSGTMSTQTPTVTNPAGNKQIDNYCRGTFTNNGCLGTNIYITNVTLNSLNNTSTCDPGANFPINYSWFGNLSTNVEQGSTYPMSATTAGSTNAQGFAAWIDWNNNGLFTDAGEYYNFPLIPSGAPATTTFNLTVPPAAPLGSHRMRVRNNFSTIPTATDACTNLNYGETEDYSINVTAATNMTYASSTTTQTVVSTVFTPATNAQMIGVQVVMTGTLSPVNVTSFTLNTNGSTNPGTDISKARLFYTGTSSVFNTSTQFGNTFLSPNGSFIIPGNIQLSQGTNYFWLTYDVPSSAANGNTLDAECSSIIVASVANTPTVQAPAGSRLVGANQMSGGYTIPGNYPNFTAAVNDLNTRGVSGPVTFTVAPGFIDTAANLVITTSGTITNPIIFKNGAPEPRGANPIIVAGTGISTTTDGIIKISGGDYITFDGIDLQENPANVTTTTQMEWGYALVKPSGTDGCQNVTIKNCAITLNKTNALSTGIYSNNHLPATTTALVVSATSGANSNNLFQSNNISNCYIGVFINGYIDISPFAFYDQNNTVSNCNISNYGGVATTAYGVYNIYQNGLTINGCNINSTGGTNSTGTLYGIFCSTMSNSSLTISNNTIQIVSAATTSSIYAINFGNGSVGTSNNINILNNVVQNCDYTTATSGVMYHIYCNATNSTLNVSGNTIKGSVYGSGVSTGQAYYIYNLNSSVNSISITNNLDSGNTVNGTTSYALYHISNQVTTNDATITGNRIKNNVMTGTTTTATAYGIINSAGTLSCTFTNNTFSNNTIPSTSSNIYYCMNNATPAPNSSYSNNTVSGNSSSGTGAFYSLYYGGAPGLGGTVNITNNSISNQQKLTATGTGVMYGIYQAGSGAATYNMNNNSVNGISSAAASQIYGIYQIGSPPNNVNINNNSVGNLTNAGVASIWGINNTPTTTTVSTISQDSVFNLSSPGGTLFGILASGGATWHIFKNKVSGITSHTGTAGVVSGIHSNVATTGATVNMYDNFVSDLNASASTSIAPAVTGINLASGAATTTYNIFYNTVYLNTTSSSVTTFGTAGIYALTSPIVDLRNNVVVNKSVAGPTGGNTAAYRRSSTILTTYSANSNNNCFYSGTPSAANLIFFDGTNSDQTLAAYKTRVISRDAVSVTENVPFVNGAAAPYDLRIQTGTPTALESGGKVVSTPVNVVNDIYNTARFPNAGYPVGGFTPIAPDIGAHEFGGLNADNVPPSISYTPLGTGGTSNRPFNNVIITDASGVNTTAGTRPRCYYKRSTDGNTINDNTNATDGWKYVESNGTTSPFDFTIDYSLLNGGTGVTTGQSVQYFVVAQDLVGTPNVAQNQAIFTLAPATVALAAANCPITTTLSYLINTNTFSGNINVGTAQTYTSLTGAAGIFAAINAGTVSGNITILITSDMTEDGTNQLNALNETGVGGYTVTIAPATASMKTISGAVANGMIRLSGSRKVVIDGNGGFEPVNPLNLSGNMPAAPFKYLTFRNTNISNPTFTFINDAVRDTIRNCIIEGANTGTASGLILFSTTTGIQGNDSNVISNCDIRDRSDVAGTYANGIYSLGTTTSLTLYNNFNKIVSCNIYNNFIDVASTTAGIFLTSGSSDWTIDSCSFYQTVSRVVTVSATYIGAYSNSTLNNNILITNSYFGGTAPLCGGTALTYTGAGLYTYNGIQLLVGGLVPSSIQGNTIQNINLTTSPATGSSVFFRGITVPTTVAYCNIGNVTGNTIGAPTGNGSISLSINTTTTAYLSIAGIFSNAIGNINNNRIGSITLGGNATSTAGTAHQLFPIQWTSTVPGWTYNCSNNLIGSLTTPNSIFYTDTLSSCQVRPIILGNAAGTINNITGNTIANITNYAPANTTNPTGAHLLYGITGSTGIYNISSNNIFNLSITSATVLPTTFLLQAISQSSTGITTINQNTISSLSYTATSTGVSINNGMFVGGATGSTIQRNKINDLKYSGTATTASTMINGIFIANASPGSILVSNNMVTLTNGDPTDVPFSKTETAANLRHDITMKDNSVQQSVPPVVVMKNTKAIVDSDPESETIIPAVDKAEVFESNVNGQTKESKTNDPSNSSSVNSASIAGIIIQSASVAPMNFYYNSVYVGGTQPGSSAYNSWAFIKQFAGPMILRNNVFVNNRSGGAGNHYAVSNQSTNLPAGWPPAASNYNSFVGGTLATLCEWGAGNPQNFTQWLAISNGDKQSYGTNTAAINPSNLFTNITTGDLSILSGNSAAWIVSGKGIALTGQNIDFSGDARVTAVSGGCTDIGADEFAATPPSNPVATQTGTPGPGNTTTYTLYGRTICTIDWNTGGTSYPTTVNVNYQSGLNPVAPNITNPQRNSNSYWTAVPVGSFNGTTYDITWFFGDNETFNITSPNTNTLLAKNDLGFWMTYPIGAGNYQSDMNWNTLSVKVRGMLAFSSFALSDAALPAEFPRTPAHNSTVPLTPTLVWSKSAVASTYRVQVASDSLFNTVVFNDSTVTDTTRIISSGLVDNTNYWWRVNGKNGTGTGGWSQVFKFRVVAVLPPALVNLKVIPGGFYNSGSGRLNMKDTLRVLLVDSTTCTSVDSNRIVIDSVTFSAQLSFSNVNTGNYYIFVFHRNHIPVASRFEQTVTRGGTVAYDFTTDSAKIFGFNAMKIAPGIWGMIPGDANRDQFVDGLDQTIWILQNGLDGYLSADFNGDSFVDGLDQTIWILFNGNSSFLPCNITLSNPAVKEQFIRLHEMKMIDNQKVYEHKQNEKKQNEQKQQENPVKDWNNDKQNNDKQNNGNNSKQNNNKK